MRRRIYVAGAYSSDNVIDMLGNMRRGMKLGAQVLALGLSPFVPWLDNQLLLVMDEEDAEDIAIHDLYEYSIAWLAVADAVLVADGSEGSVGTQREIEYAEQKHIPVFYSIDDLTKWTDGE